MPLNKIGLYWHTVRYLKPVQLYGRLWFRLVRPTPDLSPAPNRRPRFGVWVPPIQRPASLTGRDSFYFLNVSGRLATVGWNGPQRDKLWRYNQHYFDDLNAVGADGRAAWHDPLLLDWVRCNPPGVGDGWEPFPTSLRIVNWVKWALAGNRLPEVCIQSLGVQSRWLAARVEWHLLANHLLANAKALVFSGLFFEGSEADAWRKTGLEILGRQLREQVLADGGHFELSPMYHALVLEDILDLINLARVHHGVVPDSKVEAWAVAGRNMLRWLQVMRHPDGQIALFNDAAFAVAGHPAEIEAYSERLGLPAYRRLEGDGITQLADSGYVRVQRGDMLALLDVARVGSDYQPGHAHADTLSFELSLYGRRVFVNSGTSVYGAGSERMRQRSTSAHNTVVVDDADSSEVWGGFRVARRARPFDMQISEKGREILVRCAHDGYQRLPSPVTHRREWRFEERALSVTDTVEGWRRKAVARFHLHPDVRAQAAQGEGSLTLAQGQTVEWRLHGGKSALRPSSWHYEFGVSVPSRCLEITLTGPKCVTTFVW